MSTLDSNGFYVEFALRENYDDQMDSNLNRLSRFGFHLSIKSRALTAPPGGEAAGDAYIPAATATGVWLGKEGQIAFHNGTGYVFGIPRRGWRALIENEGPSGVGLLVAYTATGTWATVGADDSAGAAAAVAEHVGLADPHTQYATNAELTAHIDSTKHLTFMAFADFPTAVGNSGVVIGASDIGPAPGMEMISDNVIWRPRGGRQKLWRRADAQAPVQSLTEASGLVSPTFPAGLMKVGFGLESKISYSTPGIGTGTRTVYMRVGAVGTELTNAQIYGSNTTTSGGTINGRVESALDCITLSGTQSRSSTATIGFYQNSAGALTTLSIDFSAAWNIALTGLSAAETAITITAATWAAGTATYTATAHTLATGDKTVVAGITPAGFNATGTVTVIDANTFTLAIADPGSAYVSGGTSSRISNVTINSIDVDLIG